MMEQIFKNYLINKNNEKPTTLKPPKIDVKKKDYDTIVKLVDSDDSKQVITPIGPTAKRRPRVR